MYPNDYRYTKEHEWIKLDKGLATVGITHYAQEKLGDLVFVELPPAGAKLKAKESLGTVESVKAVSDVYAPASGSVTEVNAALRDNPGLVNEDAHGRGWLIKLKLDNPKDLDALLSAREYEEFVRSSEESQG